MAVPKSTIRDIVSRWIIFHQRLLFLGPKRGLLGIRHTLLSLTEHVSKAFIMKMLATVKKSLVISVVDVKAYWFQMVLGKL